MKHYYLVKSFLLVVIIIFIQSLIAESQFVRIVNNNFNDYTQVFICILAILLILFFWAGSFYYFYKFNLVMNKEKVSQEGDRLQLDESVKMVQTLQAQRHDFRNQLQVIKILAQLNKTEEIDKYISDCDMNLNGDPDISLKIDHPVIAALVFFFASKSREKGIDFQVDCDLDFKTFNFSPAKVTRILGNIIQNAIEVLEPSDIQKRMIQLMMWQTSDSYCFLVWNNGPVIPENIHRQIFDSGFSLKNSTGLGLNIVKELVEESRGKVTVSSNKAQGTEFKLIFPRTIDPSFEMGNGF